MIRLLYILAIIQVLIMTLIYDSIVFLIRKGGFDVSFRLWNFKKEQRKGWFIN